MIKLVGKEAILNFEKSLPKSDFSICDGDRILIFNTNKKHLTKGIDCHYDIILYNYAKDSRVNYISLMSVTGVDPKGVLLKQYYINPWFEGKVAMCEELRNYTDAQYYTLVDYIIKKLTEYIHSER
ncbi:hypothetical protein D3C81_11680 [compost metagenome]